MTHPIQAVDLTVSLNPSEIREYIANQATRFEEFLPRKRNGAQWIKTAMRGVRLGVFHARDYMGETMYVLVYEGDLAVGVVRLEQPSAAQNFKGSIVTPHSMFLPMSQGKGYASSIYIWALNAGICLVSAVNQSAAANKLWIKLGKTWPWFVIYDPRGDYRYEYAGDGTQLSTKELNSDKTRLVLLGRGWNEAKFAKRFKLKDK